VGDLSRPIVATRTAGIDCAEIAAAIRDLFDRTTRLSSGNA